MIITQGVDREFKRGVNTTPLGETARLRLVDGVAGGSEKE